MRWQKSRHSSLQSCREINLPFSLSFPQAVHIIARHFFDRTQTRSLLPWAAVDPDRRLNNP
ncbi:hypothetical protein EJP81_02250 [Rahnella aquatilis]|nr:hypothetical protein EJP79_02245 [Rahnella aquatilis]AZP45074.1 hypothetical protein EJP81_02250 [Rahnella aquatilis]AZP49407.1 hypothetical protein EJP80_02205 [Rahnella aquatilis]QBJ09274.1 hypothetical protein EYS10_12290 [Rahnella aquatilis]